MMNNITDINNRRFVRVAKPLAVRFSYLDGGQWKTSTGVCRNISEGGIFLETNLFRNGTFIPQDKINLSIFFSNWDDKADTLAEVVWLNKSVHNSYRSGIGLKFIYLSARDRARIANYVSEVSSPTNALSSKSYPVEISVSTVVKRNLSTVFQLIKDMERFPIFMEDILEVIVVEKDENKNVTNWKVALEDLTLEWTQETIPLSDENKIKFKMISGDFKSFYGEWKFLQLLTGTRIDLAVTLGWGIPILEKHLNSKLNETARFLLQGMLRAIKKKLWVPKVSKLLKFAAVIHPLDIKLFSTYETGAVYKRETIVSKLLEWTPPFEYAPVTGVKSLTGKRIDGELILCPLLPQHIINLESNFVTSRIIEAGHIAERLGAKIFCLAAYTAFVGKRGTLISKALKIPVTTGTNYTIATVIEGVLKAASAIGIDVDKSKMLIVGATGSIGSICSKIFSEIVRELYLAARNQTRLSQLAQSLVQESRATIHISTDINHIASVADIIITVTNTPSELINIGIVQPGTLIYDISLPKNISQDAAESRKDVLVADGGVIRPPGEPNFNLYYGLPLDLTYACIAESMILTLEERFECYSIGGNVSLEKVKEMSHLASKHGFQLAELRSFGKLISQARIKEVSNHCLRRETK